MTKLFKTCATIAGILLLAIVLYQLWIHREKPHYVHLQDQVDFLTAMAVNAEYETIKQIGSREGFVEHYLKAQEY
jgi:hypothetical protein